MAIKCIGANSEYINVPDLTWQPTTFSVSFWLNPVTARDWNQQIKATNGWGEFFFHARTGGAVACGIDNDAANRFEPTDLGSGTIIVDEWHAYAFTIDASKNAKFYRDGVLLASKTFLKFSKTWDGFTIGRDSIETIDGLVADVRIYNRALSAEEVASIHAGHGLDFILRGLEGWWLLDGQTDVAPSGAGIIKDRSKNAYHGTPVSGPVFAADFVRPARRIV